MNDWVLAAVIGGVAVAAIFGFAWLRGASPRRLVWQDFSRVRIPNEDERWLLDTNVRTSLKIYVPALIGAIALGGLLIGSGQPIGLAILIAFGIPPLLAMVRALRVRRFLKSIDSL